MVAVIKKYKFWAVLVILLGIFLRCYAYCANPSFWHDECALALNILSKSYLQMFGKLDYLQVTPPFFMILTKFLTHVFGLSEMVFRFLPVVAGCLSVIVFYFLCEKALKTKAAILCAILFFALNNILINYSLEFKPYSLDVLFTIICLLFFIDLNLENIKRIKLWSLATLFAIIPWFSFAPLFSFCVCFGVMFLESKKNLVKKLILVLPCLMSLGVYFIVYAHSSYKNSGMVDFWQRHNAFMSWDLVYSFRIWVGVLGKLFSPINYILFFIILFFWGLLIYFKDNIKMFWLLFLVLIAPVAASFLQFYPYCARLVLFLIPLFILCIVKPLDSISSKNKAKSFLIILLLVLSMGTQLFITYKYTHKTYVSKLEFPREMLEYISKHSMKNDVIFVNQASNVEFLYYNSIYKVSNEVILDESGHGKVINILDFINHLPKGKYWFYMPWNIIMSEELSEIGKFPNAKILYENVRARSFLIYLEIK